MPDRETPDRMDGIAVIGMAGRFPGAAGVSELWANLVAGVESIRFFSDEELFAAGVEPEVAADPHYVKAGGAIEGIELFDAEFFGYSPREAETLDPQQRLLLETSWKALEDAGYDIERLPGPTGVYVGVSENSYLVNLYSSPEILKAVDGFQLGLANDKDFAALRVAYKLNLKGPAITVQTACSTSLVAAHLATQALLTHQCDMALAGGASVAVPQASGYFAQEGGIASPDGHCRAFDARGAGTVGGSGVGVVVLKRLADAVEDGDRVRAVILSSAVNNDGSDKVGFTAPSVVGVRDVVASAHALADIDPETIRFIEAHGTATPLGDPIEVAGLREAFRTTTGRKGFCALGSVKSNVGHLDAAAGVTGLIKAALVVETGVIPPSLHFTVANPELGLESSPFFVNDRLIDWPGDGRPRRAGVSALGFGGTNAHLVLEEPPPIEPSAASARGLELLLLSAATPEALADLTNRYQTQLQSSSDTEFADVAYTSQVGRQMLPHRRVVLAATSTEAAEALEKLDAQKVLTGRPPRAVRPIAFLLPGLGDHHPGMASELYRREEVFRRELDRCAEVLAPELGLDPIAALFPVQKQRSGSGDMKAWLLAPPDSGSSSLTLQKAHPLLFAVEYALAKLWMSWGVQPASLLGYSLGEYVAACLAGIFDLEDALRIVAWRARECARLPPGEMVAVALPASRAGELTTDGIDIAATCAPEVTVLAGDEEAVTSLEEKLRSRGISHRRLAAAQAFHTSAVASVAQELERRLALLTLRPPQVRVISNLTGEPLSAEQAVDPSYWSRQMTHPVRFAAGVAGLCEAGGHLFLEIGPGQALTSWVLQSDLRGSSKDKPIEAFPTLPHQHDERRDEAVLLRAVARLWLAGQNLDWQAFHAGERRRRVAVPTYPFQRRRYWVDRARSFDPGRAMQSGAGPGDKTIGPRLYLPSWRQTVPPVIPTDPGGRARTEAYLVVADELGVGRAMAERLSGAGRTVWTVEIGEEWASADRTMTVRWNHEGDYRAVFEHVRRVAPRIAGIAFLPPVTERNDGKRLLETMPSRSFEGLRLLLGALVSEGIDDALDLLVVTSGSQKVAGDERPDPGRSMMVAVSRVVPQEYPNILCRTVDLPSPLVDQAAIESAAGDLVAELLGSSKEISVALRHGQRWVRSFEPLADSVRSEGESRLREGGVYLVTGGLGRIGLLLARHLAETYRARLALVSRSGVGGSGAEALRRREAVRALETLGAEVLVVEANVADRGDMAAALRKVEERFDALHGVIHAAGVVADDSFHTINTTGAAELERHLRPKALGVEVLEDVLAGRSLDFCLLISSVSPFLGGLGFSAYAAANRYMDAFVQRLHARGASPWMVVNFDAWDADLAAEPGNASASDRTILMAREGIEAFESALQRVGIPQLVACAGDFDRRRARWLSGLREIEQDGTSRLYPRPGLANPYEGPGDALEEVLTELWQQLLGVERVGVQDDFFELGGDSLLGTRLFGRIREIFGIELPLQRLFESRTCSALASTLRSHETAPGRIEAIARVRLKVERLSADEVEAALAEFRAKGRSEAAPGENPW